MNWLDELDAYCEPLRAKANYNTGSISRTSCMILRDLTEFYKPKVIVEIGTFIGKSTLSMKADHIYTCDKDNDCLPSSERITCFPKTKSTTMLAELVKRSVVADFFFFDGRIQREDIPMILSMSHPNTVYAFDDFYAENGRGQKGIVNVNRLHPLLPKHRLTEPVLQDTTIAVLYPESSKYPEL
jgi:predicted O-methyltransferase YrrM